VNVAGRVRGILERLLGRRLEAAVSEVVTDAELLQRFTITRDEAAFELLVWRYGAMVLGLCRRAVRDEQLAEDAFQAVFLVLARKARAIRGGNVGGWLFRVARRVAARAARRRPVVQPPREVPAEPRPAVVEQQELTELLDAEVARLPDRLRRAVILCYLGDHTTEDAARELGCPRGTVLSRLATARKRLAERLTRRGVTLPAVGAAVAERTTGRLVSQTIAAAQDPFRIPASTGPAILAESVVRAMATTKLAVACGAVILAAGQTLGVGWVAAGTGPTGSAPASTVPAAQAAQPAKGADPSDKKPADKTAALRKQADEIARRIEALQARMIQETPEADTTVDVSVLQSELFAVDKSILVAENQAKLQVRAFERAVKEQEAAAKRALDEREVASLIDREPGVREAAARLVKAGEAVASLKSKLGGDHPVLKAASNEVADAEAALKAAREKAKPEVERQIRDHLKKSYVDYVASAKERIEASENRLDELRMTRKKFAERIAEARRGEAKRQVLQDELRVLREIQLELLRQRTLAELGLEGLPPTRTELDPRVEAQIKDLKREIEVLRAEVEKLRKKN
jgi:RNA polymerase sigma factor (sigma-70 family)